MCVGDFLLTGFTEDVVFASNTSEVYIKEYLLKANYTEAFPLSNCHKVIAFIFILNDLRVTIANTLLLCIIISLCHLVNELFAGLFMNSGLLDITVLGLLNFIFLFLCRWSCHLL